MGGAVGGAGERAEPSGGGAKAERAGARGPAGTLWWSGPLLKEG